VKRERSTVSLALLLVLLVIVLFPIYVMVIGAFKPAKALNLMPPDLLPFSRFILNNVVYVLTNSLIFRWLLNSFLVSTGTVLITVFIAATAGYSLSKKQFRGRSAVFAVIIATMILPRQLLIIPNFLVANQLHLTNKLIGVVLTSVAPSFGIFLCRQFMSTIPTDFMDAADIDGCGEIWKFIYIIVPLAAPAFGALSIFTFLGTWNDFLWQFIMIQGRANQTVPIGIAMFAQSMIKNLGYQMAAAFIATIPILAVFLFFQRFFIKGITIGGVKG
jgi:multiple sugar transport system permease protein